MEGDWSEEDTLTDSSNAFLRAFHQYIQNLPEKKNKKSILSRLDLNDPPTPEQIQDSMRIMEAKHSQKPTVKIMKRVLGPVISAMKDYYGVLDTITQADPTPGMVVWGALKIVIDGLGRYVELFDKIKSEVMTLTTQLTRLALYEHLYGKSPEMQEYLFRSYVNVFRFWCRVDKECHRCSLSTLLRATASFSLKKLQSIVSDLKENADEIDKLVLIIEGQYAGTEREEARIERSKNQKERDQNSEWRKQMLRDQISSWLGEKIFNEATLTRHQNNLDIIKAGGTCDWLIDDSNFQDWLTGKSEQPVLWLFAGPGTGKSILCSHAYKYVEKADLGLKTAVALQFYEFDNQHSATAVARGLAAQLFASYRCLRPEISEDLRQMSQKNAADLSSVLQFIQALIKELPRTYIFFDGLDEECSMARWKEAVKIIDFFISLAEESPKTVRIWFSSQNQILIRAKLDKPSMINIDIGDHIKNTVDDYISSRVPGLENPEVDQEARQWILTKLRSRAEGNFLWATLMLNMIENDASSFDEMERLVKEGLPKDLDHYYHQIFARYESTERELASKIFAMVTFAKRRLRLSELREAIGIVSSHDPKTLRQSCIPWRQAVEKLFAPLIETQPDPQNKDDYFCHLSHGTVESFLLRNERIFLEEPNSTRLLSEAMIARACILYLLQDKYSHLLVAKSDKIESEEWFTSSGENVAGHHFLTYCAKYWDKHLDHVADTTDLKPKVENFVRSANFLTLLQIQSLYVESQFGVFSLLGYCKHRYYIRRVFPLWFIVSNIQRGTDYPGDYRSFISEWRSFLDCGTRQDQDSLNAKFAGQLDRCFWGALGPQNFLSGYPDRYNSFVLSSGQSLINSGQSIYADGVASDGSRAVVLQLSQETKPIIGEMHSTQDSWALNTSATPSLLFQGNIKIELDFENWKVFAADSKEKPKIVSFSPNLSHLRIGFQLFSLQDNDRFIEMSGIKLNTEEQPSFFEHLANRGDVLVLSSRRKMPKPTKILDRSKSRKSDEKKKSVRGEPSTAQDFTTDDCPDCAQESSPTNQNQEASKPKSSSGSSSDDSDDSSTERSSSSSSTNSTAFDSAEESFSEGSTDVAEFGPVPWKTMNTSDEDTESDDSDAKSTAESDNSEDQNSEDNPVHSYGQLLDEDESDGGDIDFENGCDDAYLGDSDGSGGGCGSESCDGEGPSMRFFFRARAKRTNKYERGQLQIYDLKQDPPKLLFELSPTLPLLLYDSPPIIHPTKPLVVWPLFGGDILFVDFEGQTHFTRRTRVTTKQTRHISMQCDFSPCGQYLHMVSLEGQQKVPSKTERKAGIQSFLVLSAFVSTHRLSTRKTARSPPVLIHRAKASLGTTDSLNPNKLPAEITWSPSHVYLSISSEHNLLNLLRIELFPSPITERHGDSPEVQPAIITVPRLPVLLPRSAQARQIHYYPPTTSRDNRALVIIGSRAAEPYGADPASDNTPDAATKGGLGLPGTASPPIGFYLDEEKDLGGWVASNALVPMEPGNDKGSLKAKMERFAPVGDCDIEQFFFQHPPRY